MPVPTHPLAEVFGFPCDNLSETATRYRQNRLCPYHNGSPNCTKSSVEDPIGVCSIFGPRGDVVITCPVRFRQDWTVTTDAAAFFFPADSHWTTLTEVRLTDKTGRSAGSIDMVLLSYDEIGRITGYGAVEIQAVYISGNVKTPFKHYMEAPANRFAMQWTGQMGFPRPDHVSSSRKRLAPQLISKGGILHAWNRRMVVVLNRGLFDTLPPLEETDENDADIAWMVYDLVPDADTQSYLLRRVRTVFTRFEPALAALTRFEHGDEAVFLEQLQDRLTRKLQRESLDADGLSPVIADS